jgi:hypothetical protein
MKINKYILTKSSGKQIWKKLNLVVWKTVYILLEPGKTTEWDGENKSKAAFFEFIK